MSCLFKACSSKRPGGVANSIHWTPTSPCSPSSPLQRNFNILPSRVSEANAKSQQVDQDYREAPAESDQIWLSATSPFMMRLFKFKTDTTQDSSIRSSSIHFPRAPSTLATLSCVYFSDQTFSTPSTPLSLIILTPYPSI